jgi:hypothetical protein
LSSKPSVETLGYCQEKALNTRDAMCPRTILAILCCALIASSASAQTAVKVPRPEEKDRAQRAVAKQQEKKAQRTSVIEFHGQTARCARSFSSGRGTFTAV